MRYEHFARVTIVSVSGLPDTRGAADALAISLRNMPGSRAMLCCPVAPPNLHPAIRHVPIAEMGYVEYSWFVMFVLWRFIETDYALIVQDDGWVLDGANWRDEFFDYDYCGALSERGRIDTPAGTLWTGGFKWPEYLNQPGHRVMPELNGGFSLRSRRMLRALIDHPHIKVVIPPPDGIQSEPPRMSWHNGAPDEDSHLTMILRPQLEAVGIRFAPPELCRHFSMEDHGPMYRDLDFMDLFGFHNRWRRLVGLDPQTVRYLVPRSNIDEVAREREVVVMLHRRGYRVECMPETPSPS